MHMYIIICRYIENKYIYIYTVCINIKGKTYAQTRNPKP